MNILIATSSYPLPSDPSWAPFIKETALAVAGPRFRITILVFSPCNKRLEYRESENPFVRVIAYPFPCPGRCRLHDSVGLIPSLRKNILAWGQLPFYFLASAAQILKTVRAHAIDVIHAQWYLPMGLLAVLLKPFHRKPVIVSGLGADLHLPENFLSRFLLRFAGSRADRNIACSRYLLERARRYGLDTASFQIVPNPADARKFDPGEKKPAARLIVGSLKRMVREKNLEDLVEAVSLLDQEEKGRIEVRIAGDGPAKEGLHALVRDRGLEAVVRLNGRLPHAEVPEFLRQIDVYVDTSTQEGIATSNIEAMASGCAVIAPDGYGNRDLIENGKNGILFRPRSVPDLKEALSEALRNPAGRERMAACARETAAELCDARIVARRLKTLYEECLGRQVPASSPRDLQNLFPRAAEGLPS